MSIDEMQTARKKLGLLHSDNPSKCKKEEIQKNHKSATKKEATSKNIQIKFIKKEK